MRMETCSGSVLSVRPSVANGLLDAGRPWAAVFFFARFAWLGLRNGTTTAEEHRAPASHRAPLEARTDVVEFQFRTFACHVRNPRLRALLGVSQSHTDSRLGDRAEIRGS